MKWVLTERDSRYPVELRYRLRALLGMRADAVISNSAAGAKLWREVNGHDRVYVVDNIAPTHRSRRDFADTHLSRVLVIGRLEEQKNPVVTAAALSICSLRFPTVEFDFAGDGSLRSQVQETINEHGAGDRVKVLGFGMTCRPYWRRRWR